MTNRDIFKAFGGVSEDIIEEAGTETEAPRKSKKRRVVASAASLAACAALALVLWNPSGTAGGHTAQDGTQPPAESSSDASPDNGVFEPAPPYEGVYIPPDPMPEAPSAEQGVAADMVAFFIHGGRLYTQTGQYADPSLKDGYICSVTGDIDEWSGADEYVEGASSVACDVYSVTGYNPGFRLCMAGGIRDAVMLRDFKLLSGFLAIWGTVTIGNLVLGSYSLSALSQPIAHSQYLWSFLGMALAGWGSVLLGGCPLRQLILAGEGNGDSAVTVLGMVVGAALAHNFSLAGNADSIAEDGTYVVGGIGTAGMVAVILGFVVMLAVTLTHLPGKEEA